MTTLVYIHGANATSTSWNYICDNIGQGIMIDYSSARGFRNNLNDMIAQLTPYEDFIFIGHSLGGIYSLHLANHFKSKTKCGITISTPYGGYKTPRLFRWLSQWYQLLNDVNPDSWPISSSKNIQISWPWANIVTQSGAVPWILEPNDGVVSIASQCARLDMSLINLGCNHYEVVLDPRTVNIIKHYIN